LSLPSYFVRPAATATTPTPTDFPFPTDALASPPPPAEEGPFAVPRNALHRWYFGGVLTVSSWSIPLDRGAGRGLRVGLVSSAGRLQWLPPTDLHRSGPARHRTVEVSLPTPVRAGGVVIQAGPSGRLAVGVPSVRTAEAGEVTLDGRLQSAVARPRWVFTGTLGTFGVFHNTEARGWAWLNGPAGTGGTGGPDAAVGTVSAAAPGPDGGQRIVVHTTSATALERSVAWSAGWHATIRTVPGPGTGRSDGRPIAVPVARDGIIQQVALPRPGGYLVTFSYAPASARLGIAVSAAAAAALVLWGVAEVVVRRWRRRRRNHPPGTGEPQAGMSNPMASAARR
jgi:hypothetical protein